MGHWQRTRHYTLQHRLPIELNADGIHARGKQKFEETEALAKEAGECMQPGKQWNEV